MTLPASLLQRIQASPRKRANDRPDCIASTTHIAYIGLSAFDSAEARRLATEDGRSLSQFLRLLVQRGLAQHQSEQARLQQAS